MTVELPGKLVVISPHLDDAALSIGAWLADTVLLGGKVEVVTLFAGVPDGQLSEIACEFHRNCHLPTDGSAMNIRHHEDTAAMASLGAGYRHGDFLDAVFRAREDGSWLCQHERAMFDRKAPAEASLAAHLADYIDHVCDEARPDILATCAGIGGHLDHLLAREAVLAVVQNRCMSLRLWEDLPYALDPTELRASALGTAVPYEPCFESWERKWEAISRYPSQVRMLWGSTNWRRLLCNHAIHQGNGQPAEMLWDRVTADD